MTTPETTTEIPTAGTEMAAPSMAEATEMTVEEVVVAVVAEEVEAVVEVTEAMTDAIVMIGNQEEMTFSEAIDLALHGDEIEGRTKMKEERMTRSQKKTRRNEKEKRIKMEKLKIGQRKSRKTRTNDCSFCI
jgi:hypothetical protein